MDFLQWISGAFETIVDAVFNVLPKSPIVYLTRNTAAAKYLGYINYFIPIYSWIALLENWLVAVGIYYSFKILLKWIKLE